MGTADQGAHERLSGSVQAGSNQTNGVTAGLQHGVVVYNLTKGVGKPGCTYGVASGVGGLEMEAFRECS